MQTLPQKYEFYGPADKQQDEALGKKDLVFHT